MGKVLVDGVPAADLCHQSAQNAASTGQVHLQLGRGRHEIRVHKHTSPAYGRLELSQLTGLEEAQ